MIKSLTVLASSRYALATLTATALFFTGAGLSPATAASEKETVTATVEDKTVISKTDAGTVGLTLPGTLTNQAQVSLTEVPEEHRAATESTPLANTKLAHGAVSSYQTDTGTQTLIRINSAEAAKEYRFPLTLPPGATAELSEDGSILIKEASGETLGGYHVPWAVDTNNAQVPTRFTLDGDTLIQTIDFTPETAFPVVADPNSWWGWVNCTRAIALVIAGNGLAAAKVAKIGGIAKLAKKLLEAGSAQERWGTVLSIIGYGTGITDVIVSCR